MCLYYNPNYKGEQVYCLQQVDNFAISSTQKHTALEIIDNIDKHMTIKVKPLGIISRFNGVDVQQMKYFTKLHNETYINKILKVKIDTDKHLQMLSLPTSEDKDYNKMIEPATPLDPKEI